MSATGCLQVNQMESNAHRMLTRRHLCGRRHVCARRHLCAAHLAISAHRARRHASTLRTVIYVRDVIYARNDCLMRVREFCIGTTDISRRRHLCVSMPSMAFVMSCMRGLPNRRGAETGQRACGEQAPTGPKSSALPERGVTVHSGHMGYTIGPFAGSARCPGRCVNPWMSV
jgi:hypothetical protein